MKGISDTVLIFIGILFISYSLSFQTPPANAADPKKELTVIQQKLSKEEAKVKSAAKKEKSLLSELEEINRTIRTKQSELNSYDKELVETRSRITFLEDEISKLSSEMKKKKGSLKERLRELYKQRLGGDVALILFSSKDYNDLIKRSRYISLVAYHDNRMMNTYSKNIEDYSSKKQRMEALQRAARANKESVRTKMEEMSAEHHKKDKLLASIQSERSAYEKMAEELRGASIRLQDMVTKLEKQEEEASLAGRGFTAMKGRLPWPVSGSVLVPFGKYSDPNFKIPVFKNGIEIEITSDSTINAVHGGKVVFADWFKGYGQLLIVNHEKGYHTLYGNLEEIFHKAGDIINDGTPVGRIRAPGPQQVSTLYFEIRYKGKPVDPAGWLKRKETAKKKEGPPLKK
ncbi:MAG: peptidoglycan DD-metalloendopeptidase family protein [Nitrospirae bacterium]|nr:peptidoglycan DD-metalloendopeptidase family protein [Nitrospirota bacterium]